MKHLRGAAGIILSLIFAVCFMCSPAFAASRLYQGMDVSSWQGDIDYQAVRAAGIQVVYIRTGVGLEYVDRPWTLNQSQVGSPRKSTPLAWPSWKPRAAVWDTVLPYMRTPITPRTCGTAAFPPDPCGRQTTM